MIKTHITFLLFFISIIIISQKDTLWMFCTVIMARKILMMKCYERFDQFLSRRGNATSMKKDRLLARIDCSSGKAQRRAIEDHLTEKGKHCVPTCVCACVCARHKCGWRAQRDPMHGLHGCI